MINQNEFLEYVSLQAKSIEKEQGMNPETATRFYISLIVRTICVKLKCEVPFEEEGPQNKQIDVSEEVEYILKNPDSLDILYEHLVPKEFKKKYGQFLTPPKIAQLMLMWGMDQGSKRILDPAIGTGIFFSELHKLNKSTCHVTGLDIDNLMLNLSFVRAKILKADKNINLINKNFLDFSTKEKFDLVICNPPYMKFHNFDRNSISKIASKYDLKLSKLTNIYALFFIHSLSLLKEDGVMAFITPSEFLYTGYGKELKKFLLKNFNIEAIILAELKESLFNYATTSTVITLLKNKEVSDDNKIKFIAIKNGSSVEEIYTALNTALSTNEIIVKQKSQKEIDPTKKWLVYFDKEEVKKPEALVRLGTIAKSKRGIATGSNQFFTLNNTAVEKWGIENKFLVPVVSKAEQCYSFILDKNVFDKLKKEDQRVFLLYCFDRPSENLQKYIKYGEINGINKRYLTSTRDPWYSMEKRNPAPIIATVFSRDKMRFIFNEAGVLNLASFHCIYPKFNDVEKIKALLAYLNSNKAKKIMKSEKRTYGGGLDKFEPKDLEDILVLDVLNLEKEANKRLALLFDKISNMEDSQERSNIISNIDDLIDEILKRPTKLIAGQMPLSNRSL